MRVRRRVKASACFGRRGEEGESQGGGAKVEDLDLEVECRRGVKRQRSRAWVDWRTRWKWPWSLRRWDVRMAWRRRQRCRYMLPA